MFDPTREQVRQTFFEAWRKYRAGEPLAGIETIALDVSLAHPEYHAILAAPEDVVDRLQRICAGVKGDLALRRQRHQF